MTVQTAIPREAHDHNAIRPTGNLVAVGVTREKRDNRQHVRIKMPIDVVVDGVTYRASDWSLGGFGLSDVTMDRVLGDFIKARLIVPFGSFDFTLEVLSEIVHDDRDRRKIGCRFVDLGESQVELLSYLSNAYLSGRIATVDGLLTVGHESMVRKEKLAGAIDDHPLAARLASAAKKTVRYVLLAAVGLVLVTATGLALYARLFVVEADYAALSTPKLVLRSPAEGRLEAVRLAPGARVARDEVLFEIRDQGLLSEITVAEAALMREERLLENLREVLADRRRFFAEYQVLAEAELAGAEAAHRRARTGFEVAHRNLERIRQLQANGYASDRQFDEALDADARAREELEQAEAALTEAKTNARLARGGYYYTTKRGDGSEPAQIERQIHAAEASVALQRSKIEALRSELATYSVASPCDCVVHRALVTDGEWVDEGDLLFVLGPAESDDWLIEARVPQDEVAKLRLHGVADIRLADREEVMRGRIVAIDRSGERSPRTGLPDYIRETQGYASVLVAPEWPVADLPIGLPAQVRFPLDVRAVLFPWIGSGWDAIEPARAEEE